MSRGEPPVGAPWFVRTEHAPRESRPSWLEPPPAEPAPAEPARPGRAWLPMPGEGVGDDSALFDPSHEPGVPAAQHAELAARYEALAAEHAALRGERDALAAQLAAREADAASLRARVLAASESELVRLAVAVAERVVGRELRLEPGLVAAWAREAVGALGDPTGVTVAVSPDVADTVPPEAWAGALGDADLAVDPALAPTSCVVRAGASSVDVGAARRLASVADDLLAGGS